ncbi:MAG: CotH kinase family protein, partial [Ardenticatenales bacterium]
MKTRHVALAIFVAATLAFGPPVVRAARRFGASNPSHALAPAAVPPPAPAAVLADPAAAVIDPFDLTVVHDVDFAFDRADWEAAMAAGQTVTADATVDGVPLADVDVSYKGNSSQRAAGRKKPLNVKFDAHVAGQAVGGHDVLNFNNGFSDPSFLREALTSSSLMPFMPMPRVGWARVSVGGAYFGFYVIVEQIEGAYTKRWFRSNNGWRFKADPPEAAPNLAAPNLAAPDLGTPDLIAPDAVQQRPGGGGFGATLGWLGEDLAAYKARYELKTVDAGDAAWTGLRELARVLDAPIASGGVADAALPAALGDHLDVDRALWYAAAMNLYTNFDSYYVGHNYYLWRADEDRRFHILAWDINESFGTFPGGGVDTADTTALSRVDPFHLTTSTGVGPLLRRVVGSPLLRADYLAHYRTLLSGALAPAALERDGLAMQAVIRASVLSDPNPLYGTASFEANLREDVRVGEGMGGGMGGGGRAAPGILKLANLRAAHLATLADLAPPAGNLYDATRDQTPGEPTSSDDVLIGLRWDGASLGDPPSAVTLRYTLNGDRYVELPMPGAVEGGVQQWKATIPKQPAGTDVTYYLRAVWPDGKVGFLPAANLTRPIAYTVAGVPLPPADGSDLVLNELLADNVAGDVDEAGEHEDWVELTNKGAAPIALAGYFLSDDPSKPGAWPLPDMTLAPGAYLAVWCDGDADQGPLHASFKLSKAGEMVQLATADAVVDSVAFGAQVADVSWARWPVNGGDEWTSCGHPTRGAANDCATVQATATPSSVAPTATPSPTRTPIIDPTPTVAVRTATPFDGGGFVHAYLPVAYRQP